MLNTHSRTGFDLDHQLFRESVRKFFTKHLRNDAWEKAGIVSREFWLECGKAGLLCVNVPEEYGGLGLDFRYNAIISEELSYAGSSAGITLQTDITVGYILNYGSEAQKRALLPRMVSGELILAIAMTEPDTGSDLQAIRTTARREGDEFILNGTKTYITNGQLADYVIVVAKTDVTAKAKGISLILVEKERSGFVKGKNLDKIGQHSADTSELFFQDVRVPVENLLGGEGRGFTSLMGQLPQERLSIAVISQASAQRALDEAIIFTKERKAFGTTVFDMQNTRFTLASLATKLQVGWAHLDWCLARHCEGKLTTSEACAAKLFHSDLLWEVVDAALQFHGGAGYMNETPIARLWRDARVQRIYGGTNEIMKEVIGRSL